MRITRTTCVGRIAATAVGVLTTVGTIRAGATTYTVQNLGTAGADVGGTGDAFGYDINDAGLVVGNGHLHVGGEYKGDRGFLWQNGSQTTIGLGLQSDGGGYSELYEVNNSGTAVGDADHYVGGEYVGTRGIIWRNGMLHQLQPLGVDADGIGYTGVVAMNGGGTVIGYSEKYVGGASKGYRPLVWQNGTQTALPTLGEDASGAAEASAIAINGAGVVVGRSDLNTGGPGSTFQGTRPVKWQGGTITPLPMLSTSPSGFGNGVTHAINSAGVIVGTTDVYEGGVHKGFNAARWNLDGTVTDLGALGRDGNGIARTRATLVNDAGVVAGTAFKYDANGVDKGPRALLWRDGQMFEMGTLGTRANGQGYSDVASDINGFDIPLNALGQLAGRVIQFGAGGGNLGDRAALVDEAGVTHFIQPTSTAADGSGFSQVTLLTDDGVVYGRQDLYAAGALAGASAFMWTPAGGIVDVNALIEGGPEANGWQRLTYVSGINELGQLVGYGTRLTGEEQGFVLTPVPEPAALAVLFAPVLLLARRRRRPA